MRAVLFFVLGLLVGACQSQVQPPSAPTSIELAADLESKTVALVGLAEDPITGNAVARPYCSGVWTSDYAIVTAYHCMDDAPLGATLGYVVHDDVYAPGEVKENTSIRLRGATLAATDEDHDLALLLTYKAPPHRSARIRMEGIRPGTHAQASGMSLGLWWSFSEGIVSAVRQRDIAGLDIVWVQTTAPVSPGNSGGGLFDDQGQLMGICHGSFTRGQSLNVFSHVQYVRDMLVKAGAL